MKAASGRTVVDVVELVDVVVLTGVVVVVGATVDVVGGLVVVLVVGPAQVPSVSQASNSDKNTAAKGQELQNEAISSHSSLRSSVLPVRCTARC